MAQRSSPIPNPDWSDLGPQPGGLLLAVADWIADFGGVVMDWIVGLGNISTFSLRTFGWMLTRLPRRETILPNFYQIGVLSLPVVALTGTFIGMVLVVQSYVQFRNLHLEAKLGAVINMSLVRELGPVLAATMLAGRVGSAMAAELGTMRVTEQIDALVTHGRQSDPLPGRAAVPRLPAADPGADDHGRLHGRGRGACSTPCSCWASTPIITWRTRSTSWAISTCSPACSRACSSAPPSR